MTITEKRAKQRRIHQILLDNSELSVIHNLINSTLNYEGVDISEPLITVYDYFMTRLRISCGLPVVTKEGKYKFVHDKKPKVYLSGPITGRDEKEYKKDFNSAELWLTGLGYDVINPVSYGIIEGGEWADYMRRDIKLLCDCDCLYLLDGWTKSKGSCLEYCIAFQLGLDILILDENGKRLD